MRVAQSAKGVGVDSELSELLDELETVGSRVCEIGADLG